MRPSRTTNDRAFTLLELLVVIGIISLLMGLMISAVIYGKRRANEAATTAMITDLATFLANYRKTEGMMPLKPSSPRNLRDNGSSPFGPEYYQSPSVAKGQKASGVESNKDLLAALMAYGYKVDMNRIRNGELVDYFGHPLVVRFMLVRIGSGDDYQLEERAFIWSYGYDGINAVDAQTSYATKGLPNYDNAEAQAMEAALPAGADDLTSWRMP